MKFTIYYLIRTGSGDKLEVKGVPDPVEGESLQDLLRRIEMPSSELFSVIGIRVVCNEELL